MHQSQLKENSLCFRWSAARMGSFSRREKVRMRVPRDKTRYCLSPHPSPLPEGEGIMLLLTA